MDPKKRQSKDKEGKWRKSAARSASSTSSPSPKLHSFSVGVGGTASSPALPAAARQSSDSSFNLVAQKKDKNKGTRHASLPSIYDDSGNNKSPHFKSRSNTREDGTEVHKPGKELQSPSGHGPVADISAELGNHHPLYHKWTFWCDARQKDNSRYRSSANEFKSNLKHVIMKPSELPFNSNIHFFKDDITPMWEHPKNKKGGKWVMTFASRGRDQSTPAMRATEVEKIWELVLLALIGEMLDNPPNFDVCGAVLSRRKAGDRIAVWNMSQDKKDVVELGSRLKQAILGYEPQIEYQVHEDSIKTGQSYSNKARLSIQ